MMKKNTTHRIVHIAMLSAIAVVLMFFDFPLPFFPPFLKFDMSDTIIFISSIFVGPWGMLAIIVLRSILHWLLRGAETGIPVGQLATIASSAAFCLSAYFVARQFSPEQDAKVKVVSGLVVGTLTMTAVMYVINYFWVTPFYFALAQMPTPENYAQYMLIYIPFNLIKGFVNIVMVYLLLPYTFSRTKGANNAFGHK